MSDASGNDAAPEGPGASANGQAVPEYTSAAERTVPRVEVGEMGRADHSSPARQEAQGAGNESEPPISNPWGFPEPVPLSRVGPSEPPPWVWKGFVARRHTTLLTGLWKSGKTTLLAYLLRDLASGGGIAGEVEPVQVLVVSEESGSLWAQRRDGLGIGDHVRVICRPFKGRPDSERWRGFAEYLAELVRKHGYGLMVLDTLSGLWGVTDENDAAQMTGALMPLNAVTEAGAAVLLVHHPRKGDAGEGQAARGSGALPAFVDVLVELRRYNAENRDDRRRKLTAYSRFDDTPGELVLELTEDGYRIIGTGQDASRDDRRRVIEGMLPIEAPGWTWDEVRDHWPTNGVPKPGERTIREDLVTGAQAAQWKQAGAGVRGDPHRYYRDSIPAPAPPQGAGIGSPGVVPLS